MRISVRRFTGGVLLLALMAVAVDRGSLWIWRWRVHRFFNLLREEAGRSEAQRQADWKRGKWYALDLSHQLPSGNQRNLYPVAYSEVVLNRPGGVKPSDVVVDGAGGLHLRYFPPATVWSVRLQHLWSNSDQPLWVSLYEQSYSIDIQWYGELPSDPLTPQPVVRLVYGVPSV